MYSQITMFGMGGFKVEDVILLIRNFEGVFIIKSKYPVTILSPCIFSVIVIPQV